MEVAVRVITPPLPEASRSETTFCFGVSLKIMEKTKNQEKDRSISGPYAQEAAITVSAEMKRTQALERLEKLTSELHEFVQSKVNIHKEIKAKATGVVNALRRFKKLDEEWQSPRRLTPRFTPEKSSQLTVEIEESMDTGGDGDGESDAKDEGHTSNKSNKRKDQNSPDGIDGRLTKRKDLKPSPPKNVMKQNAEKKDATDWKDVHTRKEKRRLAKEQLPKEPPKKPRPEPKRKKPLKWIRPDALIIRPAEKAKYAEILRRIKKDVSDEQVRTTVDKINKTRSGDLLITISRKCVDKGQGLKHTIANILKEEAKEEGDKQDDEQEKKKQGDEQEEEEKDDDRNEKEVDNNLNHNEAHSISIPTDENAVMLFKSIGIQV
ncbi:glutamic acid-rich protein-like [Cotesia glomerata]|uniref:glutamic acid-rich protein-like n=1 Tax=Cotesia glomerata TaxID=32391 RepID=UPI001D034562|nr:glutamic acid-rich protein-like [Cotesia glomerata]